MRKSICVYCGASTGNHQLYIEAAKQFGKALAKSNRRLIYGGGIKGLMGVLANSVLEAGGEVIGVIPERLVVAETAHTQITQLHVVEDMHTRKAKMIELADGFVALPGGLGTLEELFEVWTWSQIGYHSKPVAIFNVNGFYDQLKLFLQFMAKEDFVRPAFLETMLESSSPEELLSLIDQYQPHHLERWAK